MRSCIRHVGTGRLQAQQATGSPAPRRTALLPWVVLKMEEEATLLMHPMTGRGLKVEASSADGNSSPRSRTHQSEVLSHETPTPRSIASLVAESPQARGEGPQLQEVQLQDPPPAGHEDSDGMEPSMVPAWGGGAVPGTAASHKGPPAPRKTSAFAAPVVDGQLPTFPPVRSLPAHMQQPTATTSLEEPDTLDEIPLLRQQLSALPTFSRRRTFVRDLLRCAVALVPYLVMQVARYVFARLGVSEHRWKGQPNSQPLSPVGRKHLADVAASMRSSGSLDVETLLQPGPDRADSNSSSILGSSGSRGAGEPAVTTSGSSTPTSALVLNCLQDVVAAMQLSAQQQGLKVDDAARRDAACRMAHAVARIASNQAVNPQDVLCALRSKGQKWLLQQAKQKPELSGRLVAADFQFWCLMRQSLRIPSVQQAPLMQLQDGSTLVESSVLLTLAPGLEFLRTQGHVHEEQVAFMEQYPRMRPSSAKREWVVQAITINARAHTLGVQQPDGTVKQVATFLRSGAFAMHGRKPKGTGLWGLMEAAQLLAEERREEVREAVLARLGYRSAAALEPEIRIRTACCVAQALPVVFASLQQAVGSRTCWEAAQRTGTFLHVQQSLLSDLNAAERSYLEDTKGALELLSRRVEVRFAARPLSHVSVDPASQAITLVLDASGVPDAALPPATASGAAGGRDALLGRIYRLQTVLFSQGVNVLQSLGFWGAGDETETLQDRLNQASLETLNNYAARAGKADMPALAALNQHYGRGSTRYAKDTHMVQLVRRAAAQLGASRAVNCKSGKDRTAIELSISASSHAVEAGLLPETAQAELTDALQAGLSYRITGENNGQPNAYAFSELELSCMPPGWRPRWQLCGKVMS